MAISKVGLQGLILTNLEIQMFYKGRKSAVNRLFFKQQWSKSLHFLQNPQCFPLKLCSMIQALENLSSLLLLPGLASSVRSLSAAGRDCKYIANNSFKTKLWKTYS